jgi:hypothetical protein
LKVVKEEKFKTEVKLIGNDDSFGSWVAHGFIVHKKNGVKFWMYKQYDNKKKAE